MASLTLRRLCFRVYGGSVLLVGPLMGLTQVRFLPEPTPSSDVRARHTQASGAETCHKRPLTIADGIEITRWADQDYFDGESSDGRVAKFSPDGKRFVVVLQKGNLTDNTNRFSLYLFNSATALQGVSPELLATFSSSSNREGIGGVKWLEDNETVLFLAENPGENSQIYAFNIREHRLTRLTDHETAIRSFDTTGDGRSLTYLAEGVRPGANGDTEVRRNGIVVTNQALVDLLISGHRSEQEQDLFVKKGDRPPVPVALEDPADGAPPLISPNGHFVAVETWVEHVPPSWFAYGDSNERVRALLEEKTLGRGHSRLQRFLLLDTVTGALRPLLDAPLGFSPGRLQWLKDREAAIVQGTFLPPAVGADKERERPGSHAISVEIALGDLKYRKLGSYALPSPERRASAGLQVVLEEDVNAPPKLYAIDEKQGRKVLLVDLNPQLSQLKLGKVETIRWKMPDGNEATGGLYLPPDYEPAKRYPLVIQTHGFSPDRFSMDGRLEWSSAFAARPLAARGVIVLQSSQHSDNTPKEGPYEMARYERAIELLDRNGMIDPKRVGIAGFSRTVYQVGYALTHSKYHFAAAVLVDGIDGSYFNYISYGGDASDDILLNGAAPFGEEGLRIWMRNAPGFNLDKVSAPLALIVHNPGSLLALWEWFTGLRYLNRPVELVELPYASHLLVKPWERRTTQQLLVDWFCFWLKDEEDTDPAKREQYARWRQLRQEGNLQHATGNQVKGAAPVP
jgi:dipeptidyl aminopeptidase/acylaminoacyl peptidase